MNISGTVLTGTWATWDPTALPVFRILPRGLEVYIGGRMVHISTPEQYAEDRASADRASAATAADVAMATHVRPVHAGELPGLDTRRESGREHTR